MKGPPSYVIEAARKAAIQSPCAKSKRGAALFNRELADQLEPGGAWAPGSFRRASTPDWDQEKAEASVVLAVGFNGPPPTFSCRGTLTCHTACAKICLHAEDRAIRLGCSLDDVADLELVHVKVVDGQVVAGGGPSCWQCSRTVVEVGLRGVWLYERVLLDNEADDGTPLSAIAIEGDPVWRFYEAKEFHAQTLRTCGLEIP